MENRIRFPLEVIAAVRAAVGDDFIVGMRMSFDEQRPDGLGIEPDEAIRMAAAFTRAGIDFFSVIRGRADTDAELARAIPPMATPRARTWSSRGGCGSGWTCPSCTRRGSPTSRRPATPSPRAWSTSWG